MREKRKKIAYLTVLIVGICIGLKWLLADNFLCSDFKCEVGDVKWLLGVLYDAFINIVTIKMEAQTKLYGFNKQFSGTKQNNEKLWRKFKIDF